MADHDTYMKHAIALGSRHQGLTGVNPSVGCLLVNDNKIVGRGITSPGGRPHAEINALLMAGPKSNNATAYVTLEPCAHEGSTPSCARVLSESGVKQVVIAVEDPDPRTKGKGCDILKNADVDVVNGVQTKLARDTLSGYLSLKEKGRPFYQLKMGVTKDFKIAEKPGVQSHITNALSRKYAMLLRAQCDGILLGIETVLTDDPQLTVRIEGLEERSPTRIILDSQARLPEDAQIVRTADEVPVFLCVDQDHAQKAQDKFKDTEVHVLTCSKSEYGLDLGELSNKLAEQNIGKIMIEGGSKVAASFMRENLIDEIALFQSEHSFGEGAIPALEGADLSSVLDTYKKTNTNNYGSDTFTLYQRN